MMKLAAVTIALALAAAPDKLEREARGGTRAAVSGDTRLGKPFVSQCAPETLGGDTLRQKVLRYQQTLRFVLNRRGHRLAMQRCCAMTAEKTTPPRGMASALPMTEHVYAGSPLGLASGHFSANCASRFSARCWR